MALEQLDFVQIDVILSLVRSRTLKRAIPKLQCGLGEGSALRRAAGGRIGILARARAFVRIAARLDFTLNVAGLTADDAKADVKGQTKQILDKVDKFLAEAGTDKSKILSANIWLTDITTWGQMNEVWDAWISPGNAPARATVEAKLANPALKVEIMVQCAK